ncbi:Metallo-beta-lactamase family protein, partial [Globisporangium splendens]
MEVVVLGSGPSSSVPSIRCLLTNAACRVCHEAHANPASKNRRLNPSILVRNLAAGTNLLVDCGKTFREAALRVFPQIGVTAVHGVVLTHGHADAVLGLDDLREVQAFDERIDPITKEHQKIASKPLILHCSPATREEIRGKFEYMIEQEEEALPVLPPPAPSADATVDAAAAPPPFRWVAKARFQLFEPFVPFEAVGFKILPFPVIHGAGYISSAFEFGHEVGARVVYISDVSELTSETRTFLNDTSRPQIDLLIIDALYIDKYHSTHMNFLDVLREIRTIRPKLTLLTGMSHDLDYERDNAMLAELRDTEGGLNVQMAYDGQVLSFPSQETQ